MPLRVQGEVHVHSRSLRRRQDPPPRRRGRAEAPDPDDQPPEAGLTALPPGTAPCMWFTSGSWELYAETFGDPADPPVVLLHGAGNSMMAWDAELCERLAGRGRFVVRLDSRDAGRSVRPDGAAPYSMHDQAGDVVALLDALELAGRHARWRLPGRHDRADRRGRAPGARQRPRADLDHAGRRRAARAGRRAVRGRPGAAGLDRPRGRRALSGRARAALRRGAVRRGAAHAPGRADRRPRRRHRGAARVPVRGRGRAARARPPR